MSNDMMREALVAAFMAGSQSGHERTVEGYWRDYDDEIAQEYATEALAAPAEPSGNPGELPASDPIRSAENNSAQCAPAGEQVGLTDAALSALRDAATSLETISRLAGRKTYGKPPIETFMDSFADVRAYAASRASVARTAIAAHEAKRGGA